jgi:hypothetical protein
MRCQEERFPWFWPSAQRWSCLRRASPVLTAGVAAAGAGMAAAVAGAAAAVAAVGVIPAAAGAADITVAAAVAGGEAGGGLTASAPAGVGIRIGPAGFGSATDPEFTGGPRRGPLSRLYEFSAVSVPA